MSIAVLILLSVAVLALTVWKAERPAVYVLCAAFLLRMLVLLTDYCHWGHIPFAGADTEDFHITTLAFNAGTGPIKTNYTYVLALFYRVFGDGGRLMAQFFNVLLSYGAVMLVYATLRDLEISRKRLLLAVSLVAFMPATLFLSGVLLREAWIQFFLTLSACAFVWWYRKGSMANVVVCLTATYASMLMHAGCIGALAVYAAGFLLARTWKTVGGRTYAVTACLLAGFLAILLLVPDLLLAKFHHAAVSGHSFNPKPVAAGSSYLMWMKGMSLPMKLLLSPVRMFYLLFSPLPFDWRDVTDGIVFMVDSVFYIVLIVMMFRRPLLGKEAKMKRFLIYTVFALTFVFAMGTTNAGTAVRHRAKFLPVIVLAASLTAAKTNPDSRELTDVE